MAEVWRDPRTSKNEEIQNGDLARMVREGREEEVLEYLASVGRNAQQRELDECVVMAIQHKQAGIMKHLVEAGAIEMKHDAMKELLQGADPDEHREMFESLLHVACRRGAEPAVRYLLDRGVDVSCEDELNRTPLIHAVEAGCIDIIQCLVNLNLCDVNFDNGAAMRSALKCAKKLPFHRPDQVGCLYKGFEPIIRCLVEAGASLNFPDEDGHTLLMGDNAFCRVKCYRDILLQHGADVNAVAEDGCSVLWMAVHLTTSSRDDNISFAAVKDLLAQNIDIGVSQHQYRNMTPLQAAFDQRDHALCNLLLDADCSLYRINEYLTNMEDEELEQEMEEVRARILEMCDEPYSLKVQARLAVLRAIGQGDLRENLHRIYDAELLPNALVNYLGKAIKFNIDRM